MQGAGYEAVVLYRECPGTKQTSLRGAKKIATLRSQQAMQSHDIGSPAG